MSNQDDDELGWLVERKEPLPENLGRKLTLQELQKDDLEDELRYERLDAATPTQMISYVGPEGSSLEQLMPDASALKLDTKFLARYRPPEWAERLLKLARPMKDALTRTEFEGMQFTLARRHKLLSGRMLLTVLPEKPPNDIDLLGAHLNESPPGSVIFCTVDKTKRDIETGLASFGIVEGQHYTWLALDSLSPYEQQVMETLVGITQWGGRLAILQKSKEWLAKVY